MQTYEIIVSGRAVHANSADTTLVRTSIGIDKIHVLFDNEEWTAFPVRVTFANGDTIISTSLTLAEIDAPEWAAEAECAIPWEVIQDLGGIRITFQGTDASGNHIITEASGEPLSVVEAGDVGSGTVPSPAPSVDEWNQAYANAMAAANLANGAAESADEATELASSAAAEANDAAEEAREAAGGTVPIMSATQRGGAKLGSGLEVDSNEKLNVKVDGTTISVDSNGALHGANSYELPTMSKTVKGGATLGSGLTVDDGALSLGNLVQSGSGAEVLTDGCAIYGVSGEGWATQDGTPTPDNHVEIEVARGHEIAGQTGRYVDLIVKDANDVVLSTTPIPLPSKGFAASLPDGTADALTVDSAGRYVWECPTKEHTVSAIYNATDIGNGYMRGNAVLASASLINTANAICTHAPAIANQSNTAPHFYISGTNAYFFAEAADSSALNTVYTGAEIIYPLATPTIEHGYIDLPALPSGATVSIPELESIGVSWFVDGVKELVEHAANIKPATESRIGGVKPDGTTITADENGVITAVGGGGGGGGYVLPPATSSTLGGVKVGSNLTIGQDGTLSAAAPYTLPNASASTLGGVKVGSGLAIDANGVLSLDIANGDEVSY